MLDRDKSLAQVAVVTNSPFPHVVALLIATVLIGWALNWRSSTIVENRDSGIALLNEMATEPNLAELHQIRPRRG